MICRKIVYSLFCLVFISAIVLGQQDETRDVFLKGRILTAGIPKPPGPTPTATPKIRVKKQPPPSSTPKPKQPPPSAASDLQGDTLGIGYTLFMVNSSGDLIRVSADRQFNSGDRISLWIEPNRRGYIYLFAQENDGPPKMIFPNSRINNGMNLVEAHQSYWVPAENAFELYNSPAREKITLVFSEVKLQKLPPSTTPEGVAIESALFSEVAKATEIRKGDDLAEGMPITKAERPRGVRLSQVDPAPSFILLNKYPADKRIVANIQLTHR